jgi:hypothetical protein
MRPKKLSRMQALARMLAFYRDNPHVRHPDCVAPSLSAGAECMCFACKARRPIDTATTPTSYWAQPR